MGRHQAECLGVELHDLGEMGQEIGKTMIAGIGVVFVLHTFFLQFLVEGSRSFFESVVVILATVEINGHFSQRGSISFRQQEWTVFIPVRNDDGLAEDRGKHAC